MPVSKKRKLPKKSFKKLSLPGYDSVEYWVWCDMINKCYNPEHPEYPENGGKGIEVCKRWLGPKGFKHFFEDMGPAPKDFDA